MILLSFNIISCPKNIGDISERDFLNFTIKATKSILWKLENAGVKATFFVEIKLAENLTDLINKIVAEGHEIAFFNTTSSREEIQKVKQFAEKIIEKKIRGIRQKDHILPLEELKSLEFSYVSNIENAGILFPFKRLERSTEILDESGVTIIPESISPYSQIPYNDFVFQTIPLKLYQNMVFETLKKEDFVSIYLNSWQFMEFGKAVRIPFYRKYNSGRKMEDKLTEFLFWINKNEFAVSRIKDYIF